MSARFSPRLIFAATAVAAAALGLATWLLLGSQRIAPPEIGGYVLAEPRDLPAVELVDEQNAPFRTADFAGHWSLLYFGYTYCPDVCPLTLIELANMKRLLGSAAPADRVEFYLVSVDPRRDTPARLREYVAYFDPAFHGLTGSAVALTALAQSTDTLFDVPEGQDGDHYLVSHSSNLVLLDPHGQVHAILTPPHDPAALATDFTKIAAHYAVRR